MTAPIQRPRRLIPKTRQPEEQTRISPPQHSPPICLKYNFHGCTSSSCTYRHICLECHGNHRNSRYSSSNRYRPYSPTSRRDYYDKESLISQLPLLPQAGRAWAPIPKPLLIHKCIHAPHQLYKKLPDSRTYVNISIPNQSPINPHQQPQHLYSDCTSLMRTTQPSTHIYLLFPIILPRKISLHPRSPSLGCLSPQSNRPRTSTSHLYSYVPSTSRCLGSRAHSCARQSIRILPLARDAIWL